MTTEKEDKKEIPIRRKKKVKTNFKEVYYALPEEEMQSLLARAKNRDQLAQAELLVVFNNFLSKYVSLLWNGRYIIRDYDIRRFIGLFIKNPTTRFALLKLKFTPEMIKDVHENMQGIHYMVTRLCTEEDVQQTVYMAFIQCISVYKRKDKIPFSGFLYSYFFYILKKHVETFLIDQLGRKTFPLIEPSDAYGGDDNDFQGVYAPPGDSLEEMMANDQLIDEFWVFGDTVNAPFDCLSIQDRQLLRWRYIDKLKTSDIAERITEHPNTIREHFGRIRVQLQEAIAADTDLRIELGF